MNKMKLLYILLVFFFYTLSTNAQFVQYGKVLEYNGNTPKSNYNGMVDIYFNGASTTYKTNGFFQLYYNRLSQGNKVRSFEIKIGDKEYVLFNRPVLQRWILTPDLNMEILLCKKSRIDNLINTYTRNNTLSIEQRFSTKISSLKKEIEKLKVEQSDYKEKVHELEFVIAQKENELLKIKTNAIMFAYIDETRLDSLERLKREYNFRGDIEKAIEIGNKIDYNRISNSLIENSKLALNKNRKSIEQLFNLISYIEQHILNLKLQSDSFEIPKFSIDYTYEIEKVKKDTNISQNILIITKIYEYLIDLYSNQLRCEEDFLLQIRNEYAHFLFEYAIYTQLEEKDKLCILTKASENGEQYANYVLAEKLRNIGDLDLSKRTFQNCLKLATDSLLREYAIEDLESIPDFFYTTKDNDSIYCHILDNKDDIVLTKYTLGKEKKVLVIPNFVKHNNKRYNVKRIGAYLIYGVNGEGIEKLIINEGIRKIGRCAFRMIWSLNDVKFPSTLKTIGDAAFEECHIDNLKIPEGVESIGDLAFWNYFVPGYSAQTLTLPSTLRNIKEWSFGPDSLVNLIISKENPCFQTIRGIPYSKDSTYILRNIIPNNVETIWLSKYINPVDKRYIGDYHTNPIVDSYYNKELKEYIVDKDNPYCESSNGVLFDKLNGIILAIPCKQNDIYIPTRYFSHILKYLSNIYGDDLQGKRLWIENTTSHKDIFKLLELYYNSLYRTSNWNGKGVSIGLYSKATNRLLSYNEVKRMYIEMLNDNNLIYDSIADYRAKWMSGNFKEELIKTGVYFLKNDSLSDLGEAILHRFDGNNTAAYDLCVYYSKKCNIPKAVKYLSLTKGNQDKIIVDISNNFVNGTNGFPQDISLNLFWLQETAKQLRNATAAFNLARNKSNTDAIFWYERAIEWGDSVTSALNAGVLYNSIEKYDKAYNCFKMAYKKGNKDAANFMGIYYKYGHCVKKNTRVARFYFKKAIQMGDSIYAPINLAIEYESENKTDSAFYYFNIAGENKNADALNQIAYYYAKGKNGVYNIKKAMECIDKAIAISPEAKYFDTKGEIAILQGNIELAKEMWNKTLLLDSTYANNQDSELRELIKYQSNTELLYQTLLQKGDSINAAYKLGELYYIKFYQESNSSIPDYNNSDVNSAKKYFKIAAEHGNQNALFGLYQIDLMQNDSLNFKKYLSEAIKKNSDLILLPTNDELYYWSRAEYIMIELLHSEKYDIIIEKCQQFLKYASKNDNRCMLSLHYDCAQLLADSYVYKQKKEYDKALEWYLVAYMLFYEREHEPISSVFAYKEPGELERRIGFCYSKLWQHKKDALEWYDKAIQKGNPYAIKNKEELD